MVGAWRAGLALLVVDIDDLSLGVATDPSLVATADSIRAACTTARRVERIRPAVAAPLGH